MITSCDLFEEKPLVLALSVPSSDCENQLEAMESLSAEGTRRSSSRPSSAGARRRRWRRQRSATASTFPVLVDRDLAVFNLYRVAYCSTAIADRGGTLREFRANNPLSGAELEKLLPDD